MQINVVTSIAKHAEPVGATALVVPAFEDDFPLESSLLERDDEVVLQSLADRDVLTGKAKNNYYLPTPNRVYGGVLILGLGKLDAIDAETVRRATGEACAQLSANRIEHVYLDISKHATVSAAAFVEAVLLGQYDFDVFKTPPENGPAPLNVGKVTVIVSEDSDLNAVQQACELAALACLSTNGARHLANTPPNELTPAKLAEFAQGIAKESGCECTILEQKQMETLGMNSLLAVSRGSVQPPRLIILRHHHSDDAKTIAIVGKGVTFDTGGISLKPGAAMHEMKYDMCGAAAVLCAMMNIVELKPAINVICVVPAVENMPDADAMRPGDIVKAYNGKTIEVHNTDAEGRMILADALAYTVAKYKPDSMVDLATLTGACVIALGHHAAGLFTQHDDLAETLTAAGETTGERLWRLPLWTDHERLVDGNHADLCNIGPREGGAISAAAFLKQFVGDTPWVHLDIAGTAWEAKHLSYLNPKHASGFGVRLLTEWILKQV